MSSNLNSFRKFLVQPDSIQNSLSALPRRILGDVEVSVRHMNLASPADREAKGHFVSINRKPRKNLGWLGNVVFGKNTFLGVRGYTLVSLLYNGQVYQGISLCYRRDQFRNDLGLQIAAGRAAHALVASANPKGFLIGTASGKQISLDAKFAIIDKALPIANEAARQSTEDAPS